MRTKRSLRMLTLISVCAVYLCWPGAIFGRTIYVDDDAVGSQDGLSWATAFQYLQDALAVASAEDEIRVAQGIYPPDLGGGITAGLRGYTFGVPDGATIKGGFAGVGAADPDLRDVALFPTVLTGDLAGNDDPNDRTTLSDNSSRVVTAQNVTRGAILAGLTIAHGYDYDRGGNGLYNHGASLTLRDCTFLDNRSGDGHGGAIYNDAGNIRIENSRFIRNRAGEGAGALCNVEGSMQVVNCQFIENHGGEGAGVMESSSNSDATFFHCVFRGNSAYDGTAGIASSGALRLLYCTFVENHAQEHTGAVSCTGGNAVIAHCLFCQNRAEDTGAIHVQGASVSLEQCTFYGNVATDGWAGAVYCRPAFQWIDGAILTASLHASGCIFWANGVWGEDEDDMTVLLTGYSSQIGGDPNAATVEYCCIEGWTPEYAGTGNIGDDPLFVAPDTGDFHLKSQAGHWDAVLQAWIADDVTSPCIDAGDPLIAVEHELFPNGGVVNMGAYGGTCEASKSWFGTEPGPTINLADINGDGNVDAEDYRLPPCVCRRWISRRYGSIMRIQWRKEKSMGTKRCVRTTMSVLLCVVFAGGLSPTWARTVYVDDGAAGAQDGTSWASAFRYLQDALAVASAEDEIRVAQGIYQPDRGGGNAAGDRNATFRVPDEVSIKGGFAGVGAADPDLRDSALFATILTGDLDGNDDPNDQSTLGDNSFHVVTADGVSNDTVLDGLTIAHGNAADGAGGGLRNIGATYIVRDCTFFRNRAHEGGGGVLNADSYTLFVGCTFRENSCDDDDGGGMKNQRSYIRIEDCRFIRNYANDDGGGLYNADRSLEVINCEFLENSASERGGGVSAGHATFFNCIFRDNSSGEGAGAVSGGDTRLILCRFVDNFSWEGVGGVECGDDLVVVNCTFANNSGEQAGAILARRGSLSVKHCTFWGNAATVEPAGGIYCRADCSVIANSCIFWANRGAAGGGGAIIGYRAQVHGNPTGTTLEYCCLEGWVPERGGTGNIGDDPLFVAPDAGDFHLRSQAGRWDAMLQAWIADDVTSPCIDAADPLIPVEHELFPNGGIVNMGVYGGTCEASKSWFGAEPCSIVNAADINGDGRVDAEDYRLIAAHWLGPEASE